MSSQNSGLTPPQSVATVRAWLVRSAEAIGDPYAGRLLAELAASLEPRPQPPSRAALARRIRAVRREHYPEGSDLRASVQMRGAALRFAVSARASLPQPVAEPAATWWVLTRLPKLPSARTIRRWLSRKPT